MAKANITPNNVNPVFIGGMGGSGTRVVVEILQDAGCFVGTRVNKALDNMYFAVVTMQQSERPDWPIQRLRPFLELFHKLNFGTPLSRPEKLFLQWSALRNRVLKPVSEMMHHASQHPVDPAGVTTWVSKNGTTQFYLRHLSAFYPGCRYVHVLRHGLDMAFSSNTNQLRLFGSWLDIPEVQPGLAVAARQLKYWIRSNTLALEMASTFRGDTHYVLRYDDLCNDPATEIGKLLEFLEVDPQVTIRQLCSLVQPSSVNRYQQQDLSIFSQEDLKAVQQFGYKVTQH